MAARVVWYETLSERRRRAGRSVRETPLLFRKHRQTLYDTRRLYLKGDERLDQAERQTQSRPQRVERQTHSRTQRIERQTEQDTRIERQTQSRIGR